MCVCVLGLSEPVDSLLMFLSGYDTLEYSWVKATAVSVRLRILFVMLQNTNTRLALSHACALQKVHHVLALREEQAIAAPLHMHPQEVMELTEVLHSELRLQRSDGALKESDRGGHEHNVVDVEQQVDRIIAAMEDE